MSQSTGKRKRVPAALHSELTEYASLLRALRTQHALDLSAHLSQLPSQYGARELSLTESEPESEDGGTRRTGQRPSEIDQDEDRDEEDRRRSTEPESTAETLGDTTHEDSRQASQEIQGIQTARLKGKKRKRGPYDIWTRWPLLAGDVYPAEFGLEDEVQSIASWVARQQRQTQPPTFVQENETSEGSGSDTGANTDTDEEIEELDDVATRAVAASTAHHLRSLLSACAVLIPCVAPSLRSRLAPLNWTSVLGAAAANGLASPETVERVGLRLEALYGARSQNASEREPRSYAQVPSAVPDSVQRFVRASTAVRAARERLNSLYEERIEQGDGDYLSFVGPPRRFKRKKKAQNGSKKADREAEDELAKAEIASAEEERQSSQSSDSFDERILDLADEGTR
ncbi:hypothetical protein ACEPAI_2513 [Sanghuangporus weigelae]